jgi:hypothetical protein
MRYSRAPRPRPDPPRPRIGANGERVQVICGRKVGSTSRPTFGLRRLCRRSAGSRAGGLVVTERVGLGGAPAARAADRLMAGIAFTPFFAPGAERCAFTAELSISVTRGGSAQATRGSEDSLPEPALAPAVPAVEDRRVRPVFRRQGPPPAAFAQHRDNAAEHPPIVHAPWPRMHHRQVRLDRRPLYVVQPEQARHDPSFALCQGDPPHRPHVN